MIWNNVKARVNTFNGNFEESRIMRHYAAPNCLQILALVMAMCSLAIVPAIQAQTVTGSIGGTIRDQQGAVVPNAAVSATNRDTGAERTATSDASGSFNIVSVPAGSYDVSVAIPGFQTEVRSGIKLTVGAALRLDFSLSVGAISERVEVAGEAPQVDTTTSTMAGLVADTAIRELPLNGRDWLQLGILQSGVIQVESQTHDLSTGITHGIGMKMSISGGRPSQNLFRVDGLVVNDQTNNSPGSALGVNLGVDAIKEFSVLTSTYTAEYGRSAGGVINAITKSGTNSIHGSAFYFIRNSALDARNFFDRQIPPFRRNQFGGSVGGPIKKDKLFYFGNYEGLRQFLSASFSSNTLSPNARNGLLCANPPACTTTTPITIDPRIKPYLPLFPLPNGAVTGDTGKYVFGAGQIGSEDYTLGRIDYLLSSNTTVAGSYMFDNSNLTTPDAFDEKLGATQSRDQRVIVSLQHVFSATVLNTVRTGFMRAAGAENFDVQPHTPLLTDPSLGFVPGRNVGSITVPGLSSFGGIGSSGSDIVFYTAPQLNDDLAWVKGRNNFRFGFSVESLRDNIDVLSTPIGQWQFGSIRDFLTVNNPNRFSSDFPGTNTYRGLRMKIFGFYIQDDLRLRPRLTLNVGLRYEPTTNMSEINGKAANLRKLSDPQPAIGNPMYGNPTLRNFAPRVGLAWDPSGNGLTAVRLGFGVFDIPPLPNLMSGQINHSVPFYQAGVLVNPPASSFPNNAFALLGPSTATTNYIESQPPAAYKLQWNLNIERQITKNMSLTAGYVGSHGVHLPIHLTDADQVPPALVKTAPDGNLLFPTAGTIQRINPNFATITATEWYGYSTYHSLQVSIIQRLSHGISFQGAYSWSKSIDIGSEEVNSKDLLNNVDGIWAFGQGLNRGVSDFDVPHRLVMNFVWDLPHPAFRTPMPRFLLSGWELNGILSAHSGTPFSAIIPVDQARTGNSKAGSSNSGQRPNYNPAPGCSPNAINPGRPDNYIKLQCFSFPALGELGNLGRNTLRSPGVESFDFSVFKNHNAWGDKLKIQFRAEFFNIFNRANFISQLVTAFDSQGRTVPVNAALNPPTVTTSRQIQFGLRFIW